MIAFVLFSKIFSGLSRICFDDSIKSDWSYDWKKTFFPSILPQKGKLLQKFEKKKFFELVVRAFLTFSWNGARWLVGSLWQRVADWLIRREQIFCHHDYTWPAKMIFLIFFSLRERATPRREKMKIIEKFRVSAEWLDYVVAEQEFESIDRKVASFVVEKTF